ncbi:MAG: GreA/GreB family elongation factor, partial [bacterium]
TNELAEATHSGSETWHDNAAFDAAKDKKNLAQISLGKLMTLKRNATVIDPAATPDRVSIGSCIRYHDEDSGQEHEICLAGDGAWLMDEKWASVYAPVGQLLHGAKVGETRTGRAGVREVSLTILEIKSL